MISLPLSSPLPSVTYVVPPFRYDSNDGSSHDMSSNDTASNDAASNDAASNDAASDGGRERAMHGSHGSPSPNENEDGSAGEASSGSGGEGSRSPVESDRGGEGSGGEGSGVEGGGHGSGGEGHSAGGARSDRGGSRSNLASAKSSDLNVSRSDLSGSMSMRAVGWEAAGRAHAPSHSTSHHTTHHITCHASDGHVSDAVALQSVIRAAIPHQGVIAMDIQSAAPMDTTESQRSADTPQRLIAVSQGVIAIGSSTIGSTRGGTDSQGVIAMDISNTTHRCPAMPTAVGPTASDAVNGTIGINGAATNMRGINRVQVAPGVSTEPHSLAGGATEGVDDDGEVNEGSGFLALMAAGEAHARADALESAPPAAVDQGSTDADDTLLARGTHGPPRPSRRRTLNTLHAPSLLVFLTVAPPNPTLTQARLLLSSQS